MSYVSNVLFCENISDTTKLLLLLLLLSCSSYYLLRWLCLLLLPRVQLLVLLLQVLFLPPLLLMLFASLLMLLRLAHDDATNAISAVDAAAVVAVSGDTATAFQVLSTIIKSKMLDNIHARVNVVL